MEDKTENRREFIGRTVIAAGLVPLLLGCRRDSLAQGSASDKLDLIRKNAVQDRNCEWCGAREVPDDVSWKTNLVKDGDPGERLIITGTVYEPDGKTPAAGILIYFYHTDTEGLYGRGEQPRHGRYRGWLVTGADGRYKFLTVKPGHYPSRNQSAHIHMTITSADRKEDWIDSILFEGDPLILDRERTAEKGRFDPVIKLEKDDEGILRGTRDIQLDKI